MYGEIVFYTHGSTIEYGGEIFPAGELTADILNFAPEDYPPIQHLLDRMKDLAKQYEDTLDRSVWWELNNQFIELRSQLMQYRVFQILLKEDDQFLNETQQYTESYSFFADEEMDEQECSKDRWLEMYRQKRTSGGITNCRWPATSDTLMMLSCSIPPSITSSTFFSPN